MRRRRRTSAVAIIVSALALASCASQPDAQTRPPSEAPSSSRSDEDAAPPAPRGAVVTQVPVAQWEKMVSAGMVRPGCPVTERGQLRRVEVDYVDFSGADQRGYVVVNADTAKTTGRIFTRLYDARFPIRKMRGVENYGGDTLKSLQDDNTSGYNCRRLDQINAPVLESPHANGRAIDINPRENPWMDLRCDCWSPGPQFAARTPGKGKILRGGLVWKTFRSEGWIWQNIPVADYMHFDTGYPSAPYQEGQG